SPFSQDVLRIQEVSPRHNYSIPWRKTATDFNFMRIFQSGLHRSRTETVATRSNIHMRAMRIANNGVDRNAHSVGRGTIHKALDEGSRLPLVFRIPDRGAEYGNLCVVPVFRTHKVDCRPYHFLIHRHPDPVSFPHEGQFICINLSFNPQGTYIVKAIEYRTFGNVLTLGCFDSGYDTGCRSGQRYPWCKGIIPQ